MRDLHPAPPLQRGDTVATVAAEVQRFQDSQRLNEGLVILESWGLHLLEQSVTGRHWGYLAGTDQERHRDLGQSARLLACARGGWGSSDCWRTHLLGARAGSWVSLMSPPCSGPVNRLDTAAIFTARF